MRDGAFRILYLLLHAGFLALYAYALSLTVSLPEVFPSSSPPFYLALSGAVVLMVGARALIRDVPELEGPLGALGERVMYPLKMVLLGGIPLLVMPDPTAAKVFGIAAASVVLVADLWLRLHDTTTCIVTRWSPRQHGRPDFGWNLRWSASHLLPTVATWLMMAIACAGPAVGLSLSGILVVLVVSLGVSLMRIAGARRSALRAAEAY
ncbi:hypothetical protein [Brachybacterium sacelli]|uniref:Uncharacterized protein n=1 Tax=Brachybacterium sacelli TaxID=173364 RepID=A0ABS4X5Y1_9MICO|nr:hypothetical protein [Brachybacterium sacelli]MBP2383776.1 hypothetical protein [Brachybacterium sacelli]